MQKAVNHGGGGGGGSGGGAGDPSTVTHTGSGMASGMYSSSQPLTFIDSDFVGAENTQATEYNYELTFPNEMAGTTGTYHQGSMATQSQMTQQMTQPMSQLDNPALLSQTANSNINNMTNNNNNGMGELGKFREREIKIDSNFKYIF